MNLKIKAVKEPISFFDIPAIAKKSVKTVLLVRHSIRESLEGGIDPGLTDEGRKYAEDCGKYLAGLENVCFGSSARKRTVETVKALIHGGNLAESEIKIYPEIFDRAMFDPPENLDKFIAEKTIHEKIRTYFADGKVEGMTDLDEFSAKLLDFLLKTDFGNNNAILATHDIIIVALLSTLKVYKFAINDWCNYVQGAFLSQSQDGSWTVYYAVPNINDRKLFSFFV